MASLLRVVSRSFAFRPPEPLKFENGMYKVLDANPQIRQSKVSGLMNLCVAGLLGGNLFLAHACMGWAGFLLKTAGFALTSTKSVSHAIFQFATVNELYLLRDGKTIQVKTGTSLKNISISSITSIAESEQLMEDMVSSKQLMIRVADDRDYFVEASSFIIDRPVLKAILRGEEICTGIPTDGETIDI